MHGGFRSDMTCAASVEECDSANRDLPLQGARALNRGVERQFVNRGSRVRGWNGLDGPDGNKALAACAMLSLSVAKSAL
jgi:hypothetical protein